jgi:hypothetical protein
VAVDAQREAGVGVAELVYDAAEIDSQGDEDRGVGMAQLVRREALGQRYISRTGQFLVCLLDGQSQDACCEEILGRVIGGCVGPATTTRTLVETCSSSRVRQRCSQLPETRNACDRQALQDLRG